MHRLVDAHRGQKAAVILGGPSLIEQGVDLAGLKRQGYTLLVDAKAVTPGFLAMNAEPDYVLMLFPERAKDNALQTFIYRSFLAGIDIRPFLKPGFLPVAAHMRDNFDAYFESWKPESVHKRYRWRPDVFLPQSPYELLSRLPQSAIIANHQLLSGYFPSFHYPNPVFSFEVSAAAEAASLEEYYQPLETKERVVLRSNRFLNSAAISLYPLLKLMGFEKTYLFGMDMSMLGSMEFAAPFTFRSMFHFRLFFHLARRSFNAQYKMNKPFYFRPKSEFEDAQRLLGARLLDVRRVYSPCRFAAPLEGIPTVPLAEALAP